MVDKLILKQIDDGCIPTLSKYVKSQLIGAIFKYITTGNADSFTLDYNARETIEKVTINDFKQALLEHIVKFDASFDIVNTRCIIDFSKDYNNHTIGETEVRLIQTIELSINDVLNSRAIYDAVTIISKDQRALYNVISSFVEYRYVRANAIKIDTDYLKSEKHKRMIWKIEEYFTSIK